MKLHDMDSFRRNRAVRGHVGCLVHSVHRILFMPGDNDFGVFRCDLRITAQGQERANFSPELCQLLARLFLGGFRLREELFQYIQTVFGGVAPQH